MILVSLPVSRLTRRILIAENNGIEPVTVKAGGYLHNYLHITPQRDKPFNEGTLRQLNTKIILEVPGTWTIPTNLEASEMAYKLYKHHLEMVMDRCYHLSRCGMEHSSAIRYIFKTYKIEEDDFSFDTAFRLATRYRNERHLGDLEYLKNSKERHKGKPSLGVNINLPIPYERINSALDSLFLELSKYPISVHRHVQAWFYLRSGVDRKHICRQLGRTAGSVNNSIRKIDKLRSNDRVLKHLTDKALRSMKDGLQLQLFY